MRNLRMDRRGFIKKLGALGTLAAAGAILTQLRLLEQSPAQDLSTASADYYQAPQQAKLIKLSPSPARYYQELPGRMVSCLLCPNRCILDQNQFGRCRVRFNQDGSLYTLAHSAICAAHVDPIEKKPLFHFLPGTWSFSIATAGCNLRCIFCQNWQISQASPLEVRNIYAPPQAVVEATLQSGSKSIAYTYTEPTIFFEYMVDIAKLARKFGIRNVWVTCGYINPEPLDELCRYIDGANVDLKGFDGFYGRYNAGKLEPVLETLQILTQKRIWFEITNLVIPTANDDLAKISQMCSWILDNLGDSVPLFFSRFFPAYKLSNLPPTPVITLERARQIGLDSGLKYVYIGNVPGHPAENTYCPGCGTQLISRKGFFLAQNRISNGKCPDCGEIIPGIWD